MKKILFKIIRLFLFVFFICPLCAEISFSNIDVNEKDEVLFTITQPMYNGSSYNSLVYTKLQNQNSTNQKSNKTLNNFITYYPEQMELLNNKQILQIRNKNGVATYNFRTNSVQWNATSKTIPENTLPLLTYSVSNNGEWICYFSPVTDVKANLILQNVKSKKEKVLCQDVVLDYQTVPVKWSADSTILIYENNGNVYFCNPEAYFKDIEVEEKNRKLGRGSINSVHIVSDKFLAYVDDYLLYKISFKELYTLGLYSGIIGQGKIVGRLPFAFNSKTDKFSVNKQFNSIFLIQNNRLFSYLTTNKESCDYMNVMYSRPYTDAQATLKDAHVFWDKNNVPILWQEKLPYDNTYQRSSVYKVSTAALQVLEVEDTGTPYISPDSSKVAFYAGEGLFVYDTTSWKRIAHLSGERISKILWLDSNTLIVGGTKSVKKWNILSNEIEVLALSSCKAGYWNSITGKIVCNNNSGDDYEFIEETRTWKKMSLTTKRVAITQNGRYRVFLGNAINPNFKNSIYVRTLSGKPTTKVLYAQTRKKTDPKKKVALVFDAYDNSDGLSKIITTLEKYNIKSTFFINGEFIKRYPSETKQISIYNHDCASMFFSAIDLTNDDFLIDEDFVRRGLARNEDEFYQTTKKELSLYWHAPYNKTNNQIIESGEKTGYLYIDVPEYSESQFEGSVEQLISQYIQNLENSENAIIPIQVGYASSKIQTPLYQNLDLFICTLMKKGYEFVTVNKM